MWESWKYSGRYYYVSNLKILYYTFFYTDFRGTYVFIYMNIGCDSFVPGPELLMFVRLSMTVHLRETYDI